MTVSRLTADFTHTILQSAGDKPILDLACGNGRNGLYIAAQGRAVVFADRQQAVLDEITEQIPSESAVSLWLVDFERPRENPLAGHEFGAILVFRYLHRPLLPAIKRAVAPGGLVVYETFTTDHPRFGRPHNPDFLLTPGELEKTFADWEIVHSYEGVTQCETRNREQAIAQIVARKPL